MKKLSVIAAMAVMLAACGSEQSGTITNEDGSTTEYSVDRDSNGATTTVTTEDGTATFETGSGVKAELPDGYTLYPGSKVVTATKASSPNGDMRLVMFESADEPEAIAAYYRKQAEAAGVKLELEMTTEQGTILGGRDGEGTNFSLTTSKAEDKTVSTLSIGG